VNRVSYLRRIIVSSVLALTGCGTQGDQPRTPAADAAPVVDMAVALDASVEAAPGDGPAVDSRGTDAPPADARTDTSPAPRPDAATEVGAADGAPAGACPRTFCPALFDRLDACRGALACRWQSAAMGADYCFGNGARYTVRSTIAGTRLEMTTNVLGPDNMPCYALITTADLKGGAEDMAWFDPAGKPIATGIGNGEGITLTCGGASREFQAADCGGLRATTPDNCARGACP
jgi:hypothetical protein